INYVINSERWNKDPFFQSWVVNYTNASTIISEEYKDAENLGGFFSGLLEYKGGVPEWPFNGFVGQYENASWHYASGRVRAGGEVACTQQSGEQLFGARAPAPKPEPGRAHPDA